MPAPKPAPAVPPPSDAALPPTAQTVPVPERGLGPADALPPPSLPLLYNPAVEQRFPGVTTVYRSPAMAGDYTRWTSQVELSGWMRTQARDAGALGRTRVQLLPLGTSQRGVAIEALHLSRGGVVGESRPTVLFIAQQQGNEPAGAEALLVLAAELIEGGPASGVLDRLDVVVLPRANPDAALYGRQATMDGTHLASDHLTLRTPEARAQAELLRSYRPIVVVDLQEFPALEPFQARLGFLPRADVMLQYAMTPLAAPFITRAASEWFHAPLVSSLRTAGLHVEWWHEVPDGPDASKQLSMGPVAPGWARNAYSLRHAVSLTVASRGSDLETRHAARRVHTHVVAARSILQSAAQRASDLVKIRQFVDAEVSSQACQGDVVLDAALAQGEYALTLLDPYSGQDTRVDLRWNSALDLKPRRVRTRPCGYWLAADQADVVGRLRLLGVSVEQIQANGVTRGEVYEASAGPRVTTLNAALVDLPAGSYYVPLNGPLANLAIAALEPEVPAAASVAEPSMAPGKLARLLDVPNASRAALP